MSTIETQTLFDPEDHPHQRLNPLTGDWIIVSPHRTKRPWQGAIEPSNEEEIPRYDERNPLCPGGIRSSGKITSQYKSTYVFDNDFPALLKETPEIDDEGTHGLFQSRKATGVCRVMCFHPYSDLSLPLMKVEEIERVITCWIKEYTSLSEEHIWVQIFENKGKMMGCSNAHPHCQIWACDFLPNEARKEDERQLEYFKKTGKNMLMVYTGLELQSKSERIVCENDAWLVVVPYWAMWPFELLLLPKRSIQRLSDLSPKEEKLLACIMKVFLIKYDNLFKCSFPYSMGWHSAPCTLDGTMHKHWQLHAHYYPPLLRSSTVKKHFVGFEMLSGAMRDITPEKAAGMLRNLSSVHYKRNKITQETPNKITEKTSNKITEETSNKSAEETSNQSAEETSNKSAEETSNQSAEETSNKSAEETSNQSAEETSNKSAGETSNKSAGETSNSAEETSNKSGEETLNKSTQET